MTAPLASTPARVRAPTSPRRSSPRATLQAQTCKETQETSNHLQDQPRGSNKSLFPSSLPSIWKSVRVQTALRRYRVVLQVPPGNSLQLSEDHFSPGRRHPTSPATTRLAEAPERELPEYRASIFQVPVGAGTGRSDSVARR